jgi:capsid assembly protease
MRYEHICRWVLETPWAILPSKLAAILDVLALRASGEKLTEEEIRARIGAAARPVHRVTGNVAVLPLIGTISHRAGMMSESSGGTSTERFTAAFRQALADPNVGAIVIDVDSPGGSVEGVPELSSEIFNARGPKSIVAVANAMAASAAYWIATAADELVVTPSGEVGSIGVWAAHEDDSAYLEQMGVKMSIIRAGKYKIEANPFEPLTEEARAAIQEQVNDYYSMFVDAVARNRGVTAKAVRDGYGEGRVVGAKQAKALGMVDRIATLDETIQRLTGNSRKVGMSAEAGTGLVSGPSAEFRRRRLRLALRDVGM